MEYFIGIVSHNVLCCISVGPLSLSRERFSSSLQQSCMVLLHCLPPIIERCLSAHQQKDSSVTADSIHQLLHFSSLTVQSNTFSNQFSSDVGSFHCFNVGLCIVGSHVMVQCVASCEIVCYPVVSALKAAAGRRRATSALCLALRRRSSRLRR